MIAYGKSLTEVTDFSQVFIEDFFLLYENTFKLFYHLKFLMEKDLNMPSTGHPFSEIVMLNKYVYLY